MPAYMSERKEKLPIPETNFNLLINEITMKLCAATYKVKFTIQLNLGWKIVTVFT